MRSLQFHKESTLLKKSVILNSRTKAEAKATSMKRLNRIKKKSTNKKTKIRILKQTWRTTLSNKPEFPDTKKPNIHPKTPNTLNPNNLNPQPASKKNPKNPNPNNKTSPSIQTLCWKSTASIKILFKKKKPINPNPNLNLKAKEKSLNYPTSARISKHKRKNWTIHQKVKRTRWHEGTRC